MHARKLKLMFHQYKWVPGLISSLVTLLLLPLFVYLGYWQLDRMHQKQILEQAIEQSADSFLQSEDVDLKLIEHHFAQFQYQMVSLTGTFLTHNPILLDNQILDKQAGYRVLVPFLLANHPYLILIDRGWIPQTENRNTLPMISTRTQKITLTGHLIQIKPGLILQKDIISKTPSWPIRVQSIDYQALSAALNRPLLQFVVQLSRGQPDSFKILPLNISMSSNRHLGYAIQWFTIAFAVLVYYGVINIKRRSS